MYCSSFVVTVPACCGISGFVVCRIARTSRLLWCCLDNGCSCLECACSCLLFDGAVAVVVRVAVFLLAEFCPMLRAVITGCS